MLYHDLLLDHYNYPRNQTPLQEYNASSTIHNTSCGDQIHVKMYFFKDILKEIFFEASGCVISRAAASLVSQALKEKKIKEIVAFCNDELLALIGISLGPVRMKCATLILQAIHKGINEMIKN